MYGWGVVKYQEHRPTGRGEGWGLGDDEGKGDMRPGLQQRGHTVGGKPDNLVS